MISNFVRFSLLLGALGFAGCAHVKKWVPDQSGLHDNKVLQLNPRWAVSTTKFTNRGFRKVNRAKPLIYKDWVLSANSLDGLTAHSQKTGSLIWRSLVSEGVEATAVLNGDSVFFGALDGQVYRISAQTGEIVWTFPAQTEILTEPLIIDKSVFVVTANNSLYALDLETGRQKWLYARQDTSFMNIRGGSRPAYKDGVLYVGFNDGAFVAINAFNGNLKWEKQLSRNLRFRDLDSDPLIEDSVIYLLGFEDAAYCLRLASGETVWKSDVGGYGSMVLDENRLVYASTDGRILAVHKETGRLEWQAQLEPASVSTGVTKVKNFIVTGQSAGPLLFLSSKTGEVQQRFSPGRGVMSSLQFHEETNALYFISSEANLYRLQADLVRPDKFKGLR